MRNWAQEGLLARDDFGAAECDRRHSMTSRGKKQDGLPVLRGAGAYSIHYHKYHTLQTYTKVTNILC